MELSSILILDLDGTMIGDISPQICEYEINNKLSRAHVMKDLSAGLLRPYLKKFLTYMKTNHKAEFFVYTASTKDWAYQIVEIIEKVLGIEFNRPLFTRADIPTSGYKSIKHIFPVLKQSLVEKGYSSSIDYLDVKRNCIFIDNNAVLEKEEAHVLMKCPTYEYISPLDVLRNTSDVNIPKSIDILRRHGYVSARFINRDLLKLRTEYYKCLSRKLATLTINHKIAKADKYFEDCLKLIQDIHDTFN